MCFSVDEFHNNKGLINTTIAKMNAGRNSTFKNLTFTNSAEVISQ
jgi:hypothetical protein